MTITDSDRENYQATIDGFTSQHTPDDCLPTALKNILDELAERHNESGLSYSLQKLHQICEYRNGMASSAEKVPDRLGDRLENKGYTVKSAINVEMSELDSIVSSEESSYPIVELDPDYFDTIDGWDPRPGVDGRNWPHTVVAFEINSDTVLYFDPFGDMMLRSGGVSQPKCELPISQFYDLWSGRSLSRWTMWVQERPQTTLDQVNGR